MAYEQNNVNNSVFDDVKEKFSQLDQRKQIGVLIGGGIIVLVLLSRIFGGSDAPAAPVQKAAAPAETSAVRAVKLGDPVADEIFAAQGADDAVLRRNFVTQAKGELTELKDNLIKQEQTRAKEAKAQEERMKSLELQLSQSIRALNEDRRSFQQTIARQQEENARLIEDLKQQRLKEKETAGTIQQQQDFLSQKPIRERRQGITQTPLSLGIGGSTSGTPLVQGLTGGVVGGKDGVERGGSGNKSNSKNDEEPKPFIPPLGFIKGTMLNGVDALTGGTPTPALVRLEGTYKTAMNSTVVLNGCFMLVEFSGDISTERAKGKPARMTCVYPDEGAVTYSVAGYVVDSEDGVEGVPGLFFEGHAGRIALSIAAEFAAGLGDIVADNQSTNIVNSDGTTTTVITGSEAKASVYGSASDSLNSLKDYLADRASRVVPFIRIDALREIHIVLLSGTELRSEGNAWSQLFNAEKR
jgi:flagellar motility protein MotE (MotC chaperone)